MLSGDILRYIAIQFFHYPLHITFFPLHFPNSFFIHTFSELSTSTRNIKMSENGIVSMRSQWAVEYLFCANMQKNKEEIHEPQQRLCTYNGFVPQCIVVVFKKVKLRLRLYTQRRQGCVFINSTLEDVCKTLLSCGPKAKTQQNLFVGCHPVL